MRDTVVTDFEFHDAISITPDNFYTGSWAKGSSKVKLHECLIPITPRNFRSIHHLCFSAHTSFSNIRTMLECCPHLKTLCFRNVIMDDELVPYNGPSFGDCGIQQLWFHNTRPLGKEDYWLLDFFLRSVKFKALASFHFRMEVNAEIQEDYVSTEDSKPEPTTLANCSLVGRFIAQNGAMLEDLVLGGIGFRMSGLSRPEIRSLSKIRLAYMLFSIDTEGVSLILENQDNLKYLTCKGSFSDRVDWRIASRIFKCFERNSKTLQNIAVYSVSPMDEMSKDFALAQCTYNGATFACFQELHSLILAMVFESRSTGRSFGGRFINLHLLPRTLREIHLVLEDFSRHEFDTLGSSIAEFRHLERFNFTATACACYTIKLDWIKGFKQLKYFTEAEFYNAELKKSQILGIEILLLNATVDSPKIDMTKSENYIRFSRRIDKDSTEQIKKSRPRSRL